MFKHIKKNEDGRDFQVEENDIIKIRSDFGDDEIDEHDDTVNKTFINPTQVDTNDGDLRIKCVICDFWTRSISEVNNHRTASQSWCSLKLSRTNNEELTEFFVERVLDKHLLCF